MSNSTEADVRTTEMAMREVIPTSMFDNKEIEVFLSNDYIEGPSIALSWRDSAEQSMGKDAIREVFYKALVITGQIDICFECWSLPYGPEREEKISDDFDSCIHGVGRLK